MIVRPTAKPAGSMRPVHRPLLHRPSSVHRVGGIIRPTAANASVAMGVSNKSGGGTIGRVALGGRPSTRPETKQHHRPVATHARHHGQSFLVDHFLQDGRYGQSRGMVFQRALSTVYASSWSNALSTSRMAMKRVWPDSFALWAEVRKASMASMGCPPGVCEDQLPIAAEGW